MHAASSAIIVCLQSFSGCRTCSVGRVLLSSQGSHPASRELKPCVSVEVFLSWGHLDADGFLEQQLLGVPGHVNHCGLIPFDGKVVLSCMLCYCRLLQGSFPAGLLVFSQPGLHAAFSWSHQCSSCHNCRGFGTPPWPSSPLVDGPSPWSALSRVTVQP